VHLPSAGPSQSRSARDDAVTAAMEPPRLRWTDAGWEPANVSEPSLVPADSWCRASIQQRRRVGDKRPTTADSEVPSAAADGDGARQGSTFRRLAPGSGAVRKASLNDDTATTPKDGKAGSTPTPKAAKKGVTLSVPPGGTSGTSSVRPSRPVSASAASAAAANASGSFDPGNRSPSPDTLDEEKRLMQSVTDSMNRMRALRAMSDSVHKQLASLKTGKDAASFVVDGATHRVVEVLQVDAKSLPPHRAEPRVAVAGDENDAALLAAAQQAAADAQAAETGGRASRAGQRGTTPAGKHRKPRTGEPSSSFWQPEPNTNPMITNVTPSAGVTHRDGDVVKHTELKPPKARITRNEYQKMVTLQATATAQALAGDTDGTVTPPPGVSPGLGPVILPAALSVSVEPALAAGTTPSKVSIAPASAGNAAAGAAQHARTKVSTPVLLQRPASEASGSASNRRKPGGGVVGPLRTPARVSTPNAGAVRPGSRPSTSASAHAMQAALDLGLTRPPRKGAAPLPSMRIEDADDEVARDFLASLAEQQQRE
jgi:hypothetical protein